mmetsp:Transcript_27838/g.36522  ORF Transcript_27838/g.36522 Transcript_27838/m.36522 type:complete len:379 (+) Transcript_27838:259-1395(+)
MVFKMDAEKSEQPGELSPGGELSPEFDNSLFQDGGQFIMPLKGEEEEGISELKSKQTGMMRNDSFLLRYDRDSQTFLVLDPVESENEAGVQDSTPEQLLQRRLSSSGNIKSVKSLKDLTDVKNSGFDATQIMRNDSIGSFGSGLSYTSKIARPREMSDYGFGWYDESEGGVEEGPFQQQSQLATLERMAVICNNDDQEAQDPEDLDTCEACQREALEQGKEVLFQARNTNIMIGTKCFYKQIKSPSREHLSGPVNILKQNRFDARQIWFATAIGGIRIVKARNKGQHAEFQVVAASGLRLWSCWKRYSEFKNFADYVANFNMPKTILAWNRMRTIKKPFRCLDVPYLLMKSAYLQDFLQAILFESQSEELFMHFVQHV